MITIVGAGSTIAGTLIPLLLEETDEDLHLVTSQELESNSRIRVSGFDLADKNSFKKLVMEVMPSTIINCAALTNVDLCESERLKAWELNVTLPETLARLARILDAHLIQLSTDYVFNGSSGPYDERAIPDPISYYGKSKLAGENACISSGTITTIVRTNVVYGPPTSRPDFVRWVLDELDSERPIRVVNDQYSNPTYVEDVAEAVAQIAMRKRTGLYHVGGADYVNRYEFAVMIAEHFKLDVSLITPISTSELNQPAKRPLRGGLISLKAETDLTMRMRGITAGLNALRHSIASGGASGRK